MPRTNDAASVGCQGPVLRVAALAGLVALLSIALPQPSGAATITAQGAVTALTDVSQMGLNPIEARFDEAGVAAGDLLPLGLYSPLGLTFHYQEGFALIGIQDRSGSTGVPPTYWDPADKFPAPIAGGGSQTGLVCRTCGVASTAGGPQRIGLTASSNETQYLTVWDTAGYIIGQVTWTPAGSASAFVGLYAGGIPIGFVAYGNDDLWSGATYDTSGSTTYSDTWIWQGPCGNGVLDPGEQCDDGNIDPGDCCNGACQFEDAASSCAGPEDCEVRTCDGAGNCIPGADLALGTPCDLDASVCTTDQCDGNGNCLFQSNLDCNDSNVCTQDSCLPASGCVSAATPVAAGCKAAGSAVLTLSNPATAEKRKLSFVWTKGPSALASFGDIATTVYTLCVYDADGVVAKLEAAGGATCGTSDCWRMLGAAGKEKGVLFQDKSKVPSHDGIKKLLGKADDGVAGKAAVKLVALGEGIPAMATLPNLSAPVTAQLVTSNAACWTAEFTLNDATKNDGVIYKAKIKASTGGGG